MTDIDRSDITTAETSQLELVTRLIESTLDFGSHPAIASSDRGDLEYILVDILQVAGLDYEPAVTHAHKLMATLQHADRLAALDAVDAAVFAQMRAQAAEVDRLRADNQRLRDGIEAAAVELDRSADTADAANGLRALLADDGTGKLWAIHHRGSDEYHAQPSRAEAERMKAWLDGFDAAERSSPHAALHRALVVEWPLSAEQHAAQLAEAVAL